MQKTTITDEQVEAALNAWFSGNQSETDQGLERSMRAALTAAAQARRRTTMTDREDITWGDSPDEYKSLPLQLREAAMQEPNQARATGLLDSADAIVDRAVVLRTSITLENIAALQSAVSRGYYHFVRRTPLGDNSGGGAKPIEQEKKTA